MCAHRHACLAEKGASAEARAREHACATRHAYARVRGHTHTHAYARPSAAIVLLQVDASHVTLIEDIARSVCFIHHTRLYASAHARLHECARACQALKLSTLPGLEVGYCGHRPSAPVTPYSVQPLIPMRLPVHLLESKIAKGRFTFKLTESLSAF